MPNWIVTVTHNNLDMLKSAVESFLAQDLEDVRVLVVNNQSTDETVQWLAYANKVWGVESIHLYPQNGVAHAWNAALDYLFGRIGAQAVLVCNNDVRLRPETYRLLRLQPGGFVTAVGSHDESALTGDLSPSLGEPRPHPDFSCYLIRSHVWDSVGRFDESFRVAFCEDWDYHCRMHANEIKAFCVQVPFWHIGGGSQTIKRASDREAEQISIQAAKNRETFRHKYGFEGGSPEYYRFFELSPHEARELLQPRATPLQQ